MGVTHKYIYLLKPDNLAIVEFLYLRDTDAYIGQLSLSPSDRSTVWSAHIGGTILSAWDVIHKAHKFSIDTAKHIKGIVSTIPDIFITAMTLALDTVWIGMASGHILVFADEDLVTWYHPYNDIVCFITIIPCTGPCKKEECMIVTGAKKFNSLLPPDNPVKIQEDFTQDGHLNDSDSVLILWEAFWAKMSRQMKLIEEKAPHFFNNHDSIRKIIHTKGLEFNDGTQLLKGKGVNLSSSVPHVSLRNDPYEAMTQNHDMSSEPGTSSQDRRTESICKGTFHS